ncbi:MAG: pyridine nucleotide-disulfide oxidoreductase, partial [Gammaproteobacteria bacterium]|nr:pyridine nucleotide-disulfide oxidoreductase [Gammaproteobacteria bacterium]
IPDIEGVRSVPFLTSETLWQLKKLPDQLVVLGGGPIGVELAQAFSRLGSEVKQIEALPFLLPKEDEEFSTIVFNQLEKEGIRVLLNTKAVSAEVRDEKYVLKTTDNRDYERELIFDQLLLAVGRKPYTEGLGLADLGIDCDQNGAIIVDKYLRTKYPNIYAIGDVAGSFQYTHAASHMAWHAAVNALFGFAKKFKVDYKYLPYATFCYPEIARVGLNEKEAKAEGVDYEVTTFDVSDLDRAIIDEEASGLIKVLTKPGKDKILGVTIAADHAADLISEYTLAMKYGIGLQKILGTIHAYPTMMEANKFVASEWRKKNKPEWALWVVERFHSWRRGERLSFLKKRVDSPEGPENRDLNRF